MAAEARENVSMRAEPSVEGPDVESHGKEEHPRRRNLSLDEHTLSECIDNLVESTEAVPGRLTPIQSCDNFANMLLPQVPPTPNPRSDPYGEPMFLSAWEALEKSVVHHDGKPIGTFAAKKDSSVETLNYNQVCMFFRFESCIDLTLCFNTYAGICWQRVACGEMTVL